LLQLIWAIGFIGKIRSKTKIIIKMRIDKNNFDIFLDSIAKCYSLECYDKLPKSENFPDELFKTENKLDVAELLKYAANQNVYFLSISKRIAGVLNIQKARETKSKLDIRNTWNLISESISIIPISSTISSIGSQGFLSIPLYKNDLKLENFDFIRLHIWENSLLKYINIETCEKFSIHTHSFYAKSWVINGAVINDRFKINETNENTDYSLFTVGYNKSLNEINQHTSSANNNNINISLKQISHEIHMPESSYEIEAGHYHQSGSSSNSGLSATFFSFTGKDGLVDKSYVVGPSNIQTSEINRKMHIDPTELLNQINLEVNI
jgi:hypothetical protein